jgi:membrane protease YdiL (CAAX protease family)
VNERQAIPFQRWGKVIGLLSLLVFVLAVGGLMWSGHTEIRYTADHHGTIPIQNKWVPAIVCILLIRIIPFHRPNYHPFHELTKQQLAIQSAVFLFGAILFPVSLLLVDSNTSTFQLWYMGLKLAMLFILPWMALRLILTHPMKRLTPEQPCSLTWRMWVSPLFIMSVWVYLSYFSVFSVPRTPSVLTNAAELLMTLVVGFLINSLLEELFYRVWLQTRLEELLGSWPAIMLTSIPWSIWHIKIQHTGYLPADVVMAIANQGVTGLFLGYLWSRYRNMWVLIMVHGIINAPPQLLLELWNM